MLLISALTCCELSAYVRWRLSLSASIVTSWLLGLASPWAIPGEVNHGRFLWWVNYDIPDLGASPAKYELQQSFTVRLRSGYDRRGQLVPARPRARLVG